MFSAGAAYSIRSDSGLIRLQHKPKDKLKLFIKRLITQTPFVIDKTPLYEGDLTSCLPIFIRAVAKMATDKTIKIVDYDWDDYKLNKSYVVFKIVYKKLD